MRTWGTDRSDKERGGRRNEEDESSVESAIEAMKFEIAAEWNE
jgi:hypothetical protein